VGFEGDRTRGICSVLWRAHIVGAAGGGAMRRGLPSPRRMRQSSAYGTLMVGLRAVVEKTSGHHESQLMGEYVCCMAAAV